MYRPSQTPRLAVSSDRITLGSVCRPGAAPTRRARGRGRRDSRALSGFPNADATAGRFAARAASRSGAADNPWRLAREYRRAGARGAHGGRPPPHQVSKETMKVVVFHRRPSARSQSASHLCYTSHVSLQCQTRVKLNRVFFPR